MIKITQEKNIIKAWGHANYGEYGNDIVCASVSSIIYTTVNGILSIDENALEFKDDKEMILCIKRNSEIVNKLITSMMDLLEDLAKQYPKNIKIVKGE